MLALDASEWQGALSKQHFQYAYNMGVRMYIAQLWGSGPTGNGPNDFADEQLGFAKAVGMTHLAGYIWVPPDTTTETKMLVATSLNAAGDYADELCFVAPDLEGGRLHPENSSARLNDLCENLEACDKNIVIYCRKNNWATVMGAGVTEFKRYPLWEARYYFKSGYRPDTPPDIDWKWAAFGGWKQRAILQYAGTAPVKNWSADWNVVDLDRLGLVDVIPTPKPEPEQPEEETMSSKEFDEAKNLIEAERDARAEKDKEQDARLKRLETATSTAPKAPKRGESSYTVVAGDTLSQIAMNLLGSAGRFREIALLNRIKDANRIFPGQVLRIPPR